MTTPSLFDVSAEVPRPAGWTPDAPPELQGEKFICLDAETDGLEWWNNARPVGWAWYLPESRRRGYLSFGHTEGNSCDESTALRWAQRELRDVHVANAQIKFDLHISRTWGADLIEQGCTFSDVQHYAALLDDHRMRFGLEKLGQDFLGRGKVDLSQELKSKMRELPAWQVADYAIEDVVLVNDLIDVFQPQIVKEDLERVLDLERKIIPVVVEMEKNGVYLDVETLERWCKQAQKEFEDQLWFIYKETGLRMSSADSGKELEKLFTLRNIPMVKRTKAGKPSFTEDVLKRAAEHDPVIAAVFYASQLADLRSKYLDKYMADVKPDGWMRFNLHQLRTSKEDGTGFGTVSGRFSSAGDGRGKHSGRSRQALTGFNVQQVVSADKQTARNWCPNYVIRNLFLPGTPDERQAPKPPRWLAADAKQIEYRIFAHLANEEQILAEYAKDPETDYHNVVQELLRRAKPDIQRKKTKITNFCKLFGAGLLKFAWTLETISDEEFERLDVKYKGVRGKERMMRQDEPTLAEAIEVYDAYDQQFPAAVKMLQLAKSVADTRGFVKTLLGRRARFGGRYKRVHSALNRVVQGTAADINKLMLVDAYEHRHELGLTLRFTVHDELDADVKHDADIEKIETFFNKQRLPLKVLILWDVGVGESWGTAKGKA